MMAIVSAPSPESPAGGVNTAPYAGVLILLGAALLFAAIRAISRHHKP